MPATAADIRSSTSTPELAVELAAEVAAILDNAVTARGHASLIVSGGTTPRELFRELAKQGIDWRKVTISLADERWVDAADPASNEGLVRSLLLRGDASAARFIGLKNDAATPAAGVAECDQALRALPRPFDLVILGMGNDGHTASLFPGSRQLPAAVDLESGRSCIAITPPDASCERMSLTLPALLDSREIILHITGRGKKQVLERALEPGEAMAMPVRFVLRQRQVPVRIFWAP